MPRPTPAFAAAARRLLPLCALFFLLLAVAPPPSLSPAARRFAAKLAEIQRYETAPPRPGRTVILEAEGAQAYLNSGAVDLPAAVSHLVLSSRPGFIQGAADIDFDRLPRAGGGLTAGLASSVFSGVHHVTAEARLDAGDAPAARLTLLNLTLDGEHIPNWLLDLALREFVQPKHPEIARTFSVPLPAGARSARLETNRAVLTY